MDDRYLFGSCHHLAVAMHRMTGWDLALVAGMHRGGEVVFHVFCIGPDGAAWDSRGPSAVEGLVDEQVVAMDEADAWAIRLDGEAAVWALARAGKLHPIHESHVIEAIDAVDDLLDGKWTCISDGWKSAEPAAVAEAVDGRRPPPMLDRACSLAATTGAGMGPG